VCVWGVCVWCVCVVCVCVCGVCVWCVCVVCVCVCVCVYICTHNGICCICMCLPDDNLVEVETCGWDISDKWLFIYDWLRNLWIGCCLTVFGFPYVMVYFVFLQPITTRDARSSSRAVIARDVDRRKSASILYLTTKNIMQEILWRLIEVDRKVLYTLFEIKLRLKTIKRN